MSYRISKVFLPLEGRFELGMIRGKEGVEQLVAGSITRGVLEVQSGTGIEFNGGFNLIDGELVLNQDTELVLAPQPSV